MKFYFKKNNVKKMKEFCPNVDKDFLKVQKLTSKKFELELVENNSINLQIKQTDIIKINEKVKINNDYLKNVKFLGKFAEIRFDNSTYLQFSSKFDEIYKLYLKYIDTYINIIDYKKITTLKTLISPEIENLIDSQTSLNIIIYPKFILKFHRNFFGYTKTSLLIDFKITFSQT